MEEKIIWSHKPSQIINLSTFIKLVIFSIIYLILPYRFLNFNLFKNFHVYQILIILLFCYFLYTLYVILTIFSVSYNLTEERLLLYSGFLSNKREGVELYRVNDYEVISPFYLRIFGLGNVTIFSTDVKTSKSTLLAVKNPEKVADSIRDKVEKIKIDKKILFVKS